MEIRTAPAREWGRHGLGEAASALGQLADQFRAAAEDEGRNGVRPQRSWGQLLQTAKKYRPFALFGCPSALLNAAGLLLPPLLVAGFYGTAAGGSFGFAFRIVSLPMALLGTAVSQVFLAEASPVITSQPTEVSRLFQRVTSRLLPACLALLAGGALCPWRFPWVFGANWVEAGSFAAVLSVPCAAQLLVSPISNIAVLTNRLGSNAIR